MRCCLVVVVFFFVGTAGARGFAFSGAALDQFVALDARYGMVIVAYFGVGVHVHPPVLPSPIPGTAVHKENVLAPSNAGGSPAPGTKEPADADAESKADRAAHKEARARGREHDQGIIGWNHDEGWIGRLDTDVRATGHNDLAIGAEVAEVASLLAHALDSVHDVRPLGENGVAKVCRPVHVRGHSIENRGKRKQS